MRTKAIANRIIELLNTEIWAPEFGYIPQSPNYYKDEKPHFKVNDSLCDTFITSVDTFKIKFVKEVSPQLAFVDSAFNLSISITDTSNLDFVGVFFQNKIIVIPSDHLGIYALKLSASPEQIDSQRIFLKANYIYQDSCVSILDWIDIEVKHESALIDFQVGSKQEILYQGEDISLNYTACFEDYSSGDNFFSPNLEHMISDTSIIGFDSLTGRFIGKVAGESYAEIGYKGLKDTCYFIVLPYGDTTERSPIPISNFTFTEDLTCSSATISLTNQSLYANAYHWDFGDGNTSTEESPMHQFAMPGYHQVVLTATNSETGESDSYSVAIEVAIGDTLLAEADTVIHIACFDEQNGSVGLNITGGTAPYTYDWSNGASSMDVENLAKGTYSVVVTDANQCSTTLQVEITEPAELAATIVSNDAMIGQNNGAASVTPSGGTPEYTYQWTNGETTPTVNNLNPIPYSVVITDANGCSIIESVTIGETLDDPCFNDVVPPIITTCPPDATVDYQWQVSTVSDVLITVDNCSANLVIDVANDWTLTVHPDCDQGYWTNTYEVMDLMGNTATCTQIITVLGLGDSDCEQDPCLADTEPPVMDCANTSITLTSEGTYTLTESDIEALAATTSDECELNFSLTQANFNCGGEGINTVTLTATDLAGNAGFCAVDITVHPFLTIDSCTTTNETCAGSGDGSVTVVATALGGQVGYSVDGGINFQFSGEFQDLTPGTYNIVVKVFGIDELCEKTDTKNIAGGPAQTIWYKDSDGDGYTDNLTTVGCEQPAGYIADPAIGTDCNDNDATIFPGADEQCDGLDNNCDGAIPPNETDADNDGFRICAGDCDDSNANVNPDAAEVCDGLDNNCNNEIDEDIDDETYVGNIFFFSQAQLDAWPTCYTVIQGNVTISGNNITDLSPLNNLEEITGNLTIYTNFALTSLEGLNNVETVGGSLSIYYNFLLADCCAIDNLLTNGGVNITTVIFFNAAGSHCNSAASIMSACPLVPMIAGPSNPNVQGVPIPGKELNIYPNPAGDKVNVLCERNAPAAILRVLDALGRVVYEVEMEEGVNHVVINLENESFDNGVYLVSLNEGDVAMTRKLVVHR
ncbi:MAG: MopE-related protein [Bacteroidota bacterium]